MSCRQGMNCKQRQIKKKGGQRGEERGSPRQKSKQRWLQERHFSATLAAALSGRAGSGRPLRATRGGGGGEPRGPV